WPRKPPAGRPSASWRCRWTCSIASA
ncbi:MAG: Transcriptional regulator, AcrR family, partial [uncultured Ramlibacter sp.]